jgi:hypothetical protein
MGMRVGNGKKASGSIYVDNNGAICVALLNKTAGNSVLGECVKASTGTAMAVDVCAANDLQSIGNMAEAGIADAAMVWVAAYGLLPGKADAGGFTIGQWCGTGGTAKLIDGDPTPGGTSSHFQEIGHALETATDGQVKRFIAHHL